MKFEFKRDLLLINLIVLVEIFTVTFFSNDILKMVLGFPFLLFCPGYALISALFPKKDDLDTIERITLSIGLSMAIVPLIGLILHFSPYGIRLYPILISVTSVIFIFSIIAFYRRREEAFSYYFDIRFRKNTCNLVLLSLILITGIIAVQIVTTPKIEIFTEFYLLNAEGKAGDYPKNLTLRESAEVVLGIRNHEARDVGYSVVILFENEIIETMEGIKLKHEERWEEKVSFVPNKVGENIKLEFLLYKEKEKMPYRGLRLFVDVK